MNYVPLKIKWNNELVMETAIVDARKKAAVEFATKMKNSDYLM